MGCIILNTDVSRLDLKSRRSNERRGRQIVVSPIDGALLVLAWTGSPLVAQPYDVIGAGGSGKGHGRGVVVCNWSGQPMVVCSAR